MREVAPSRPPLRIRVQRRLMPVAGFLFRTIQRRGRPRSEFVEHRYGAHPRERLDAIARAPGSPERAPVVFLHGGGWVLGSKELYRGELGFLREAGHPVFNVEYPLAPEDPHPRILRSLFRSLDWIRERNPGVTGFHAMGDSAGGNLAAMLGLLAANPDLVAAIDPGRTGGLALPCHGIVSLYGVLDRRSWIEDGFPGARGLVAAYGGPEALADEVGDDRAITPMDLAFDEAPPTFLTAGSADPLCRSTRIFAERLEKEGREVVHREFPGERHGFWQLSRSGADAVLLREVTAFLERSEEGTG